MPLVISSCTIEEMDAATTVMLTVVKMILMAGVRVLIELMVTMRVRIIV